MGLDPGTVFLITAALAGAGTAMALNRPKAPKPPKLLRPPVAIEGEDRSQRAKLDRLRGRQSTVVSMGLLSEPPLKKAELMPL